MAKKRSRGGNGGLTAGPDGEPTIDIHGGDKPGTAKDGEKPRG